ncbi:MULTISPECIES: hypothetical protein [unclassified Lysobacter]|uniref:hypothetical protein n=1 Tax=unclassified Lysobacter TaxID=2635362 RepID=UPI001BEB4635|nr:MULTISPECIES: hypothetical protein [unclassified Lysobacter]MBT2748331.1 hypothetical protein [Lysobacter sp. ISL-42]MBT2749902.1 hypothetical protein [Lysobacter sp. ISL-50]MBT2781230.1 hypothetical protein [Lysobacter sp. ISL-52]
MANLKLSQLPAATALTGDEIIPLVQGGQTRRSTAAAIADLRQGAWQTPTLNASWTNYGDAFATATYRKDANRVQLRGLVKGGAGGSIVCTLPAGFRPPAQQIFVAVCDAPSHARIDVRINGDVAVAQPTTGTIGWLSLDGIGFFVD